MHGVLLMTFYSSPVLADVGTPLFDSQWLALLVILAGVAAFLLAVAAVGRWLASTHPDEPTKPVAPAEIATATLPSAVSSEVPVEIFAAIAAAVAVTLGAKARVAAISSRLQWSMEGRRQIYSSHKVR
jgi:hypothetical protein